MNASNVSAEAKAKGKAKAVSEPVTVVGSPVDSSSSTVATSAAAAASVVGSLSSGTLTLIALHDITETEGGLVAEGEAACITTGEATSATMRTSSSSSTSSLSSTGELEAESDAVVLLGSLLSTASTAATTVLPSLSRA